MITALDGITLQTGDLTSAVGWTERLLARVPVADEEMATFALDNVTLDLTLVDGDEGFAGLSFEVANADEAHRVAERRALEPAAPVAFAEAALGLREGRRVDLDRDATFGVPLSLVQHAPNPRQPHAAATADGAVTGLDHIVIRTTHPNRAAALYGARLGLDMRLDRTEPKWGARFMFFRCGDLIVEVVHNLNEEPSDAPDNIWGLSWRVANAEAANARLKVAGFDISEIRPGRKPGTRVFTVRNKTLGVPTLIVEPSAGRP